MLGARAIRGDEGEIDLRFQDGGQLDLSFLGRLLQSLQGHLVLGQVHALVTAKLFHYPVDDPLVDVVAAQMSVSVGRLDLDHAFADLQDGNVERTAARASNAKQRSM